MLFVAPDTLTLWRRLLPWIRRHEMHFVSMKNSPCPINFMATSHYQCNVNLPTFNDDGPLALWLWAVIVSIYLSTKEICGAGCHGPLQVQMGLCLWRACEVSQGLLAALHVTLCPPPPPPRLPPFDDERHVCGAGQLWRTSGCLELWLLQGTHIDRSNIRAV